MVSARLHVFAAAIALLWATSRFLDHVAGHLEPSRSTQVPYYLSHEESVADSDKTLVSALRVGMPKPIMNSLP
jgi:hypothetical protein